MAKKYRHIGKETPRISARNFVTGRAKYIKDVKRPNMLYGKILRSPYAHANIKSIDTSRAEAHPGVKVVLTHENGPDWNYGGPLPHARILDSKVRFVGAPVALIAAETEQIAEDAFDLIDVDYEPLPAVFDMGEAMKPGAPQLYDVFPGNIVPNKFSNEGMLGSLLDVDIGDTEKGFREADIIVEGTAKLENAQNPLPPEPPGIIAEWEDGKLTEWGSFVCPGLGQLIAAPTMGLLPSDFRIIATYVGAGYGSKPGNQDIIIYAAALAKAARRPVALFYTKEEHFAAYTVRMRSRASYKVGMKRDGTVTAITGEWVADAGSFSVHHGIMIAVGLLTLTFLAKCFNIKVNTKTVLTNTVCSGPFRGFGYLEKTALLASILSMAMEKAELDPVEYYKKNCVKPGDKMYHCYMCTGWETSTGPDVTRVIEKGAELFEWNNKWKGWGKPTSVDGTKRRGIGVGMAGHSDAGEQTSNGNVQLNAFGSVTVRCGVTEFGTGTRDVIRKIAAEALDLPLEMVNLTAADTAIVPWEWGSTGSRSTYAIGSAVMSAVEDAKQKLFQQAAPILKANPEDLETKDGWVFVRDDPEKTLHWISIMGWQGSIAGEGHFPARHNVVTCQVHFVEVEVDVETGETHLLNLVSSTDCGQIINPLALQGQLQGFYSGTDLCLREETIWDRATGRMLNPNMIEYKTVVFPELAAHQFVILETPPNAAPPCPFGAFGVGEPTLAPQTPAISMAIYNAIGKRFSEYPITPDKILKALGKV